MSAGECERFRDDLIALVDGELAGAERDAIERHLSSCRSCAEAIESVRKCRALTRVLASFQPADAVLDRLLADVRAGEAGRRAAAAVSAGVASPMAAPPPRASGARWFAWAAAACVLVAASVGVFAAFGLAGRAEPGLAGLIVGGRGVTVNGAAGSRIREGDLVQALRGTGIVRLADGAEIRLRRGGAFRLTGPRKIAIGPEGADVYATVPPGAGGLEVRTPDAVARVIGTRFAVSCAAARGTDVQVVSGVVEVEAAGERRAVGAGEAVSVPAGGAPGPARPGIGAESLAWAAGDDVCALRLSLTVAPVFARGARALLWLRIENLGSVEDRVAAFRATGYEYSMRVRTPGGDEAHAKLDVRGRYVQTKEGRLAEKLRDGHVDLVPGEAYVLECDVTGLLRDPGTYELAAQYLGGEEDGAAAPRMLVSEKASVKVE